MEWKAIAELLASALGLLAQVVAQHGGSEEKAALVQLRAILAAIDSGTLEGLDPATAQAELDALVATILGDRAAADARLARKFDNGGDG